MMQVHLVPVRKFLVKCCRSRDNFRHIHTVQLICLRQPTVNH